MDNGVVSFVSLGHLQVTEMEPKKVPNMGG